jgi:hypothetical protein
MHLRCKLVRDHTTKGRGKGEWTLKRPMGCIGAQVNLFLLIRW